MARTGHHTATGDGVAASSHPANSTAYTYYQPLPCILKGTCNSPDRPFQAFTRQEDNGLYCLLL
jgi:hypothetical protein